eukprot:TRINITY_DN75834_c0_g1_i1.p1 TRINITY_DN75834_c0_g1~~TRINITY_DN75834_c0_g1_i1.p1  ORF type:complete len:304 (-),score=34.42 TRINITY_DN75834_c0_g1_i1:47-916(-)
MANSFVARVLATAAVEDVLKPPSSSEMSKPPATDAYGRANMAMVGRNYKFQSDHFVARNGRFSVWKPDEIKTFWCTWNPSGLCFTRALLSNELTSNAGVCTTTGKTKRLLKTWSELYEGKQSAAGDIAKMVASCVEPEAKLRMMACAGWTECFDPKIDENTRLEKLTDVSRMFLREFLMGKGSWIYVKDAQQSYVLELLDEPENFHLVQEPCQWVSTCRLAKVLFKVPQSLHDKLKCTMRQSNRYMSDAEQEQLFSAYCRVSRVGQRSDGKKCAIQDSEGGANKRQKLS